MNSSVSFSDIRAFGNDTHARNAYRKLAKRPDRPVEHVISATTGHHVVRTDGDCWGDVMGDKVVAQTETAKKIVRKKFGVMVETIRLALQSPPEQ